MQIEAFCFSGSVTHFLDGVEPILGLDGLVREDVHLRVGEQMEVHVGHHARLARHAEGRGHLGSRDTSDGLCRLSVCPISHHHDSGESEISTPPTFPIFFISGLKSTWEEIGARSTSEIFSLSLDVEYGNDKEIQEAGCGLIFCATSDYHKS